MKTKLLLLIGFLSAATQAQTVATYYGNGQVTYAVLHSSTPIDQTPTGVNVEWNFAGLENGGSAIYTQMAPTAGEINTYPNTTTATDIQTTIQAVTTPGKIFFSDVAGVLSFTGIDSPDFTLNFATDNAAIGPFPLLFNISYTDDMAGNYTYGPYSGTFSGSIATTVDAYGTLTMNDFGFGYFEDTVRRLKTVMTANLDYGIFTNVGTATQTVYHYYHDNGQSLYPCFKTSTMAIVVPILSIDQTTFTMEGLSGIILGTNENTGLENQITIAPNPVADFLTVQSPSSITIQTIKIMDATGKTITTRDYDGNPISVSHLSKGVYFAEISTDMGKTTKKIIRN